MKKEANKVKDVGVLISFKLSLQLKKPARAKFFRDFYGYQDKSQFGRYFYQREGFLQKELIPYIKLNRAVMIVRSRDKQRVMSFLKKRGNIVTRRVILSKEDKRELFLKGKGV